MKLLTRYFDTIAPLLGVFLFSWHYGLAHAESDKSNTSKFPTVEQIGQGIKSAAQNVEREIPKMGAAIGNGVRKITGGDSNKSTNKSTEQPPKQEKK